MTGAGSGSLVLDIEDSFGTAPSTPDPFRLGRNPTVDEIPVENALQRLSQDGAVESVESIAGRFESALNASAAVSETTLPKIHDLVFNDGGTGFTTGLANTARVYAGVNYATGEAEFEGIGAFPTEFALNYSEGDNTVRLDMTLLVAGGANYNTSFTPSNVTGPALGSTVPFHGFDLSIDGTSVSRLSTATLSIGNIAQPVNGPGRTALDATIQKPETSLSMAATFGDNSPGRLQAALGGTSATSVQDSVDSRPATITLDTASGTIATYNLPAITPASLSWAEVISDANTSEEIDYNVDGGSTGGVTVA